MMECYKDLSIILLLGVCLSLTMHLSITVYNEYIFDHCLCIVATCKVIGQVQYPNTRVAGELSGGVQGCIKNVFVHRNTYS